MTDRQRGALWVVGGIVFGLAVALVTGQWFYLAIGAGIGATFSAAARDLRTRRDKRDAGS